MWTIGRIRDKTVPFLFENSVVLTGFKKTAFSNSTVFKSFHSGERFRIDPFSLTVFGVLWPCPEQNSSDRFRLKTV